MASSGPAVAATTQSGQSKRDDVHALFAKLDLDLKQSSLKTAQRDQILQQLKVYGRDPNGAEPIFTKEGIHTLARYAFDGSSATSTSREALRCLANALLLKESTRQILVDCGGAPKAAEKLRTDNTDDEFLLSRILFLMTYGTDVDFQALIKKNGLADSVNNCIARHVKRYTKGLRLLSLPSPMDDMALNETTKFLFNLTHFHPELSLHFSKAIPNLAQILYRSKITNPPLDPPLSSVINALINLDLPDKSGHGLSRSSLFPKLDSKGPVEQLVNVLSAAINYYKSAELDQLVAPVVTLLRKIYPIAPDNVQKHVQSLLLPSDADRDKTLGKGDGLPARLLRLSASAATSTLRTSISAMLYELSDSNATTFVRNVGYGYASGFLMAQNLPVPESASASSATSRDGVRINPITGQRLDAEPDDDDQPPMTEEEKEREAEKLFVLFERLKKTGVMDVRNPVEDAIRSGRFEELPDDAVEQDGDKDGDKGDGKEDMNEDRGNKEMQEEDEDAKEKNRKEMDKENDAGKARDSNDDHDEGKNSKQVET